MIKHIIVKGKVQGVSFRYYTVKEAKSKALLGTVKNRPDGDVEIFISGSSVKLEEFEKWCRIGSPFSTVNQVISEIVSDHINFSDFKIIY